MEHYLAKNNFEIKFVYLKSCLTRDNSATVTYTSLPG
jgi:hypothetical protein